MSFSTVVQECAKVQGMLEGGHHASAGYTHTTTQGQPDYATSTPGGREAGSSEIPTSVTSPIPPKRTGTRGRGAIFRRQGALGLDLPRPTMSSSAVASLEAAAEARSAHFTVGARQGHAGADAPSTPCSSPYTASIDSAAIYESRWELLHDAFGLEHQTGSSEDVPSSLHSLEGMSLQSGDTGYVTIAPLEDYCGKPQTLA
ncbi:unnamed protein product [Clonostachys rosea f. rosea IK726]|uniref:Uncharacterized protein n=3 Tax=Clonostachys rosea f. rosea IK726 TaxID=1349383 RepID=A0ACA9UEA5_BIOOC|nr:unnamed protein product [Clonostachys rosea f. rosea IK726]CAG9951417.1 unnamed protein product [Clonostachys rosea f. rosea IK726]CAG9957253.1 unnamed protein product [Clonostachys rosea f. rosea IK726]